MRSLGTYLVENHIAKLKDIDYVQTFKSLKLRYEQQMERMAVGGGLSRISSSAIDGYETLNFGEIISRIQAQFGLEVWKTKLMGGLDLS